MRKHKKYLATMTLRTISVTAVWFWKTELWEMHNYLSVT